MASRIVVKLVLMFTVTCVSVSFLLYLGLPRILDLSAVVFAIVGGSIALAYIFYSINLVVEVFADVLPSLDED